ncbi:MAG: NAD(P)H-dependent oxidoreductase [Ilumatobacteraceae bacterium]
MKVHVVHCHPRPDSLSSAALARVLAGLHAAGHEVRVLDLYADGFVPELSSWERVHHLDDPATKPDIARYAADLQWCEALVLVYPTWFSGQPGMLKGWIDRVWVRGVAYDLPEGANTIRPLLRGLRRIVVVTTHGSPKWVNVLQGEGGKRVAFRALRVLCSRRTRTTWLALYGLDHADLQQRTAFLHRVERAMTRLR